MSQFVKGGEGGVMGQCGVESSGRGSGDGVAGLDEGRENVGFVGEVV